MTDKNNPNKPAQKPNSKPVQLPGQLNEERGFSDIPKPNPTKPKPNNPKK